MFGESTKSNSRAEKATISTTSSAASIATSRISSNMLQTPLAWRYKVSYLPVKSKIESEIPMQVKTFSVPVADQEPVPASLAFTLQHSTQLHQRSYAVKSIQLHAHVSEWWHTLLLAVTCLFSSAPLLITFL